MGTLQGWWVRRMAVASNSQQLAGGRAKRPSPHHDLSLKPMRVKVISQQRHMLVFSIIISFLAFALRGGFSLWSANKVMILWAEQLGSGATGDGITIPESYFTNRTLPPSAALSFGRIAFAQGRYQDALHFYQQAADLVKSNPIILAENVISLSRAGQFEEVIAFYESYGDVIFWKREAQDALLLAYLQQLDAGQMTIADHQTFFNRFAAQELYTLSLLLQQEFGASNISELPEQAQKQLRHFSIEAVAPGDERLLHYTTRLLPDLITSGIWDDENLENVLQFWIWQYPESSAVDDIIKALSRTHPETVNWGRLRNELVLRRSGPEIDLSPARNNTLADDAGNMLGNGRFDQLDHNGLVGWHIADYKTGRGEGQPAAAFSMNVDEASHITPPYALRIDGIWDEGTAGFYGALALPSRLEGAYFLSLVPQQPYQLSGYYRTRGESERVSVYVGNPATKLIDATLPATAGVWQMFSYTACHGNEKTESMQLLLRLHSTGAVWFDNLVMNRMHTEAVIHCTQ
jgi:tetratricopeptide (TPR) repeat protein